MPQLAHLAVRMCFVLNTGAFGLTGTRKGDDGFCCRSFKLASYRLFGWFPNEPLKIPPPSSNFDNNFFGLRGVFTLYSERLMSYIVEHDLLIYSGVQVAATLGLFPSIL